MKTALHKKDPRVASGTHARVQTPRAHLAHTNVPGEFRWEDLTRELELSGDDIIDDDETVIVHECDIRDDDIIDEDKTVIFHKRRYASLPPQEFLVAHKDTVDINVLLKKEFVGTPEHARVQNILGKWMYDQLTIRAKAQLAGARYAVRLLRHDKLSRPVPLSRIVETLSIVVRARAQARAFRAHRDNMKVA